jgi:hypothetical protein
LIRINERSPLYEEDRGFKGEIEKRKHQMGKLGREIKFLAGTTSHRTNRGTLPTWIF